MTIHLTGKNTNQIIISGKLGGRKKLKFMRRNDMVNPEVYAKFEELLHSGQVERAFIRFTDGSVISIGEVDNRGCPGVWM